MGSTKKTRILGIIHELSDVEKRKVGLHAAKFCKDKEDLSSLLEALGLKEYEAKQLRSKYSLTAEASKERTRRRRELRKQYYLFPHAEALTLEELSIAFPKGVPDG